MVTGSFSQPCTHFGVFVRSVVVHDQMNVHIGWCFPVNQTQKRQEFLMSVSLAAPSGDFSGGQIQGCKQGRGAMAYIVMCIDFSVREAQG